MFGELFRKFMIIAGIYLIFQIPPIKEKTDPYFARAYKSFEETIQSWFGAATVRDFRSGTGSDPLRRTPTPTAGSGSSPQSVSDLNNQSWFAPSSSSGPSQYSN